MMRRGRWSPITCRYPPSEPFAPYRRQTRLAGLGYLTSTGPGTPASKRYTVTGEHSGERGALGGRAIRFRRPVGLDDLELFLGNDPVEHAQQCRTILMRADILLKPHPEQGREIDVEELG